MLELLQRKDAMRKSRAKAIREGIKQARFTRTSPINVSDIDTHLQDRWSFEEFERSHSRAAWKTWKQRVSMKPIA